MHNPSARVLDAILTLKRHRPQEFDLIFEWLVKCHDDAEAGAFAPPNAENVFTHWISIGELQVLRTIVDSMENVEDKVIQIKMRRVG